jgi:translation initiation factor IF-1
MNADKIELEGIVLDSNKGIFRVKITENHIVNARLSGKIRTNSVHILCGDNVVVEVSPYDMSSGRIIYRNK